MTIIVCAARSAAPALFRMAAPATAPVHHRRHRQVPPAMFHSRALPAGDAESTHPRFVVLFHAAETAGDHFDLMIENFAAPDRERSLATWRLDRWPVAAPGTAERLADHRSRFLDYEGPLTGNRGQVRRVAAGRCRVVFQSASRWRVQLDSGDRLWELELVRTDGDHPGDLWRILPEIDSQGGEAAGD